MEEYVEFSSTFRLKPVVEHIVSWFLEGHFMYMRIKLDLFILAEFCTSSIKVKQKDLKGRTLVYWINQTITC